VKLLLASHTSGRIHIINNHPQDRSNDPSKDPWAFQRDQSTYICFCHRMCNPMAKSYINLVKTVEPFEHYFTEPGLLGQSLLLLNVSIFNIHSVAVVHWIP
jgi:hypothetical protein